MAERTVHVKRTLVIEYTVPVSAYDGMAEAQIREWESADNVAPETILDSIVSDAAEVWFTGDEVG